MPTTRSTYHRLHAFLEVLAASLISALLWAGAAGASTLVITGAGDGHGVGLSQDGALGYAQHGYSYEAILSHYYRGTALGQAPTGAVVRVLVGSKVQRVPLERYVRGVVSAEVSSSWPLAALQAQAVASRTYALTAHAGGSKFDVYADTRSQVYRGVAAETATTNAAVTTTAGQIVTYAGKPAITYFFASSGGMTESVQNSFLGSPPEPWLIGVADPYDIGPAYDWTLSISFSAAAAKLNGLVKGSFRGIEVLTRGVSPRIVSARVLGSRGTEPVSGPELAGRLGLQSTWAYFSVKSGASLKREPDHSGAPSANPPLSPAPVPARRTPAPATGPQGGAPAPAVAESSATGGVAAG
jgi:stage II sporulation protein D